MIIEQVVLIRQRTCQVHIHFDRFDGVFDMGELSDRLFVCYSSGEVFETDMLCFSL